LKAVYGRRLQRPPLEKVINTATASMAADVPLWANTEQLEVLQTPGFPAFQVSFVLSGLI
jgi:hypothetical protein